MGAPWGNDEQGKQFAAGFLPNREKIDKALKVLVQGLASIDPALRALEDNVQEADRAATMRAE